MRIIKALCIFLLNLIKIAIWCIALITLLGFVMPYIKNLSKYSYLEPVKQADATINSTVKEYIPTNIANKDMSRGLTLVGLLIVSMIVNNFKNKIKMSEEKAKVKDELDAYMLKAQTKEQKATIKQFQTKIEESGDFSGKTRQQLLKDFVVLKKELEKTGRSLAFLAIDVVDSTGMKQGEDPVIVENDFNQYHDFVVAKFKENGYIKASWTPDGVMACFNTTEQAIQAARAIIAGLINFNERVKTMRRDFSVRCGINSGFVYYDVTTPLEEFSDRVIDIAGHMQKHAPVNSILVAKEIIKPIGTYEDFEASNNIVDGLEVCEWHPDDLPKAS